MRIILILLTFSCLQLNAQDRNKAALTAGSEFLDKNEQQPISIADNQRIEFLTTKLPDNQQISTAKNQAINSKQNNTSTILYIVVFLLAGIALFFFTNKNKTVFNSQINLEEEEEQRRKKELWKAMAEPDIGE